MIARRDKLDCAQPVRRILMTADAVGGVWTYALDLAAALAEDQVEVALAVMGRSPTAEQRMQALRISNLHLFEAPFKLEWMEEPWAEVARAGEWLLNIEERFGPDVVHLNGYGHAALDWRAPVLVAAHSCVLSWWLAVKGVPAPPAWDKYRRNVSRGLHAARAVVAPSSAMLSSVESLYGPFSRSTTAVVPNARPAGYFGPAGKAPFVLTAGRLWDEAKNISALDRIAPQLEWPVYAAGDAGHPDGRTWESPLLRLLGILDAATLADWMARASIFALPALYEPFGLSVLEAALSACALVLSDIPSLKENWSDAAIFVAAHDEQALCGAIRQLIANRHLRESLGARARSRALEFTPRRTAGEYLKIYGQLRCAS